MPVPPHFQRGLYVRSGGLLRVTHVAPGLITTRHAWPVRWVERAVAALEDGWWWLTGQRYVRRPRP